MLLRSQKALSPEGFSVNDRALPLNVTKRWKLKIPLKKYTHFTKPIYVDLIPCKSLVTMEQLQEYKPIDPQHCKRC